MLKQNLNEIEIVGKLSSVNLKETTNKKGNECIYGEVKVHTQEEIGGMTVPIEIPINVYANKFTKAGKDNPAYQSLKDVQEKMVSIEACGNEEEATRIRVYENSDPISENIFKNSQTGELVTSQRIKASFFNRASQNQEDKARFQTVICILSIKDEVNKDGEPTGRLIVTGAYPNYNGELQVIPYVVGNENAINHIQTYWNKGDTVKVYGKINYSYRVEKTLEEVGFGEPIERKRTVSHKEFLITSGSANALDEEVAFDPQDISKGLEARQAMKEAKAAEEIKKKAPKNMKDTSPSLEEYGF